MTAPSAPSCSQPNTKMKLKFYIVNEFDRPSARHITIKGKDGKFYYIHPDLRHWNEMVPTNPTPLEDFGIAMDMLMGNDHIHGKQGSPSVATYEDGRPRQWQDSEEFYFQFNPKESYPITPNQPEQDENEN